MLRVSYDRLDTNGAYLLGNDDKYIDELINFIYLLNNKHTFF